MKFYTPFNPPSDEGTSFKDVPSQVQTQFADQCELKFILARLQRGDMSVLKTTGIFYADLSTLPEDLQTALNGQLVAREAWNNCPDIQKRFGTPENMLDFLSDSSNREEAIKLGLIDAPVEVAPIRVEVTNPAPVTASAEAAG